MTARAESRLTDSADRALAHIARELASGFDGKIVLECVGGGVRRVHCEKTLYMRDLEPAAGKG